MTSPFDTEMEHDVPIGNEKERRKENGADAANNGNKERCVCGGNQSKERNQGCSGGTLQSRAEAGTRND